MSEEQIMTRQMYCERCAKANRPYRDVTFVVHGSSGFHMRRVERFVERAERGITPHLVTLYRVIGDGTVSFCRVCGVVGCGVSLGPDPENRSQTVINYRKVSYELMSVSDWNTLCVTKDLGYRI